MRLGLIILTVVWAVVGAVLGTLLSADWKVYGRLLSGHWPYPGLVVGAVVGGLIFVLWECRRYLPFTASVWSIKLELPVFGKVEIAMTVADRNLLWRFFLELSTRVATQPLADGTGSLREALTSLYGLFALARTELASMPPVSAPSPGKISAQAYVLKVLNHELRPLLSRWHPRLAAWETTGMPESTWPLAAICRRDLEDTRGRVVTLARELGKALGFADLNGILPVEPKQFSSPTLATDTHIADQQILGSLDANRANAGWRIFVEAASRIAVQPLAPDTGLLREALQSLYSLFGSVREELKSMTPTPPTSAAEDTLEMVCLHMLNTKLRPFLAKWHPRLLTWEQSKQPESEWSEATECRIELERVRAAIAADVRRIGKIVGVQDVDRILRVEQDHLPS
jgi:hypothetical protein